MTNESNKIYQTKLEEANNVLYKVVDDLQKEGRSLREIGKLLSIKRADLLKILHRDVGNLSYSAILRIQSFLSKTIDMKTLELNQEELYKLMISLSPHTELDGYRELQNKIRKAMGFPVGFEYDQSYDNVARLMMEAMQYDNGMCDRYNRETYPDKWVELIRQAAEKFFQSNPELLNEETIEEIGTGGEESEMEEKYGHLEGWKELNRVLGHYFDHYPEEDEYQGDWELYDYKCRQKPDWIYRCKKCGCTKVGEKPQVCDCDKIELVK